MEKILTWIAIIYSVLISIFTCYFWWLYAHNHGFLMSLFIGPIISTIKGIFWPFFI